MAGNFWKSSHHEQWILDKADLIRERNEDLKIFTEEEYQKILIFFVNLIVEIGKDPNIEKGSVHMQAISTACVYFRRFYARRPFKDIDPFLLAPTCILLAAKVEESGIIAPNKLLNATNNALKKRWPFIEQHLIEFRWPHLKHTDATSNLIPTQIKHQYLHEAEFYILEILDCSLVVYHPYRSLEQLFKDMYNASGRIEQKEKDKIEGDPLFRDAWKLCNDSLRSDCCLMYPPHLIAIAAIMVASVANNRDSTDKALRTWLSELNIDFEKVFEIQQCLFTMYKLWKSFDEPKQLLGLLQKLPKTS